MERCWAIGTKVGSNDVALGFDDGTVIIKMGREAPAASMDTSGKILYAVHSDIFSAQVRGGEEGQPGVQDGELMVPQN